MLGKQLRLIRKFFYFFIKLGYDSSETPPPYALMVGQQITQLNMKMKGTNCRALTFALYFQ